MLLCGQCSNLHGMSTRFYSISQMNDIQDVGTRTVSSNSDLLAVGGGHLTAPTPLATGLFLCSQEQAVQ